MKRKKGKRRVLLIIALAVIIIGALMSCSNNESGGSPSESTNVQESKKDKKDDKKKSSIDVYSVKDKIHVESFDLKIESVDRAGTLVLNGGAEGMDMEYPSDDGYEYITAVCKVENTGEEEENAPMVFRAYADKESVNQFTALGLYDGNKILGGAVAPGMSAKGWVSWKVPVGWKTLDIDVLDNLGSTVGRYEIKSREVK